MIYPRRRIVARRAPLFMPGVRVRRRRSLLFDVFMICVTSGLWIIWMVVRPKYY